MGWYAALALTGASFRKPSELCHGAKHRCLNREYIISKPEDHAARAWNTLVPSNYHAGIKTFGMMNAVLSRPPSSLPTADFLCTSSRPSLRHLRKEPRVPSSTTV